MPKKKKNDRKKPTARRRAGDPRRAAELRREDHVRTVYERQGDPTFTQVVRHADGSRTYKLNDDAIAIMRRQRELFIEWFGREPSPTDPVFFDPDADTPQPQAEPDWDEIYTAFDAAGIDRAFADAWRELGYLVSDMNRHTFSVHELEAWEAAVERHWANDE